MEESYQTQSKIKAKDLPGAIKVMPLGLDAAIKKRVSGEFKSERSSSGVSFSQTSNNHTLQTQPIDSTDFSSPMVNFKEMDQVSKKKTDIMSEFQWGNSISSQKVMSNKSTKSEFSSSFKSQQNVQQSYEAGTSLMTNNQQQMMNVNRNQIMDNNQHQMISNQEAFHGEEIKQHNLKSQIRSAIYDLENEIGPDFENQMKSPTPAKTGLFSPPPLERISEPPELTVSKAENFVHPSFENPIPNGHVSFKTMESNALNIDLQRAQEESSSIKMNGNYEESSNSIQESGSSASLFDKIMTPASQEFDSGSVKRRDPRKMFTDSSFYSAAHHPTVADQVEMAHRLSCALFNEENHSSKGQQMYLNRAKRSGETIDDEESPPRHDKVPNLKLVMNPKGKVQDWSDVAPEDMPNETAVAAVPSPLIDGDAGKGGELFAKRRKKAENWVVDENTTGQEKPSNFADKLMQRKMFEQKKLEQAQQVEKEQNQLINQQNIATHNQLESQQQFQMQSSSKQAQSLEIRRNKELQQIVLNQPQIDLPEDFQHCTLINQSNAISFDKSCHNVQGINVWSNTAPRGWASSQTIHRTAGQRTTNLNKPEDPLVAAKMIEKEKQMMQQQEELRFEQQMLEEQQMMEQQRMKQYQMEQHRVEEERLKQQNIEEQRMEEQRIEQQRIEQQIMEQQQMEQRIIEEQRLKQQIMEQQRIEQQRVEEQRLEQQRIEQQRIQQQQMEQRRIEEQRLEQQRIEQQRIQQQQMEQQRIEEQRLEQERLEQQRMEQQRIEQQMIEQQRVEEQILEQQRIEQQRMEKQRVEHQKLEQQKMEQKRMENQIREQQQIEHQRTEQDRMEEQSMEEPSHLQSKIKAKDLPGAIKVMPNGLDAAIKKRVSGEFKSERTSSGTSFSKTSNNQGSKPQIINQQIAVQQQQQTSMQQWHSTEKTSQSSSVSSSKITMRAGQVDLEPEKRNEYEAWFKNQEKEAMEYSASIKYQEKGSETKETNTTVMSTDQKSNQMKGDFQSMSIGMDSHEMPQVKPSLLFTESDSVNVRSKSEGILRQSSSPGSSSKLMNKWDNHNTIARGWGGMKENYHPVTFREIYNVESQAPTTSHNL